jgi:Protein of unknown function (DUF3300)
MEEGMLRCGTFLLALAVMIASSGVLAAQDTDSTPSQSDQPLLKPEQLDALVAPIALYPDALLANMLAASTYPLEVVEADRWASAHKKLNGDQLKAEVDKQPWDDSVKALSTTPTVLAMMSEKLDWTKSLGDAVLAQQPDVMDAIQRLRSRAQANNKLSSTKEQKVSVQRQEGKQAIVIEPTDPNMMYVPYYQPAVVYGDWPYPDYPPYYFGAPPYIGAGVIAAGIAFGAGFALARWDNYWRGGCNWGNNNFFINRTNNIGNNWQHNSVHRQGVRYNNAGVQQKFGNNGLRAGSAGRTDFRGRDGQQVLRPNQGTGDRAGDRGDRVGNRAGNRGGDRAGSRDRPGGGERKAAADRASGGGGRGDRAGAKPGGNRAAAANRAANVNRGGGGNRGGGMNVSSGRSAAAASARGRSSMASMPRGGGGGASFAGRGGGGGFRGGGGGGGRGGGGGGGGGGRRSDIALKHDVVLLGYLANGLGYYRFSYLGSQKAYVGVMAQEVESVMPEAVTRGSDGYLRVYYDKLGVKFRKYSDWLAGGARIPAEVSR